MQTATMKPRPVTQYEFRGVNDEGMACYDEVAVEANYLSDRPPAPAPRRKLPPVCNGCKCYMNLQERHWLWTNRCNTCGMRRMEEIFIRIADRHGRGKAMAKLTALVNVD